MCGIIVASSSHPAFYCFAIFVHTLGEHGNKASVMVNMYMQTLLEQSDMHDVMRRGEEDKWEVGGQAEYSVWEISL